MLAQILYSVPYSHSAVDWELSGRVVGGTNVVDLVGASCIVEGLQRLLDGILDIEGVCQIEFEVADAQRSIERLQDIFGRKLRSLGRSPIG